MNIGIIGLGRMGRQIARRLKKHGHTVVAWNRSPAPRASFSRYGGLAAPTIPEMVRRLKPPRIIWVMLPAGKTTEEVLLGKSGLVKLLCRGDIVIDGGNAYYEDSIRRGETFAKKGIIFFDSGTSGGIHGEKHGFSLMVGGPENVWPKVRPIFRDLAAGDLSPNPSPRQGRVAGGRERWNEKHYGLVGPAGTGHFVKMVHNGIEYGMMEALAEGLALINKKYPRIDLAQVAQVWQQGSVVSSRLVDWARDLLEKENLAHVIGLVESTGEGEWTIQVAKKLGVDVRVMKDALQVRRESIKPANQKLLRNKILVLLRNRFGGHKVKYRK